LERFVYDTIFFMPVKAYSVRPEIPTEASIELKAYHPTLQKLLYYRAVSTHKEAERFLHPDYELDLHDPFLMSGMGVAVGRILKAIEGKEKILIYSDYDADGIPGGVILREFFDRIGHSNVDNYIPHRHDEGYGLHLEAVETFKEQGVDLIITVDCGIADSEQVARAQALGMDVIITDHHEQNGTLPEAFAIVNPKQKNCTYPEQILCGSGVVFKLIQGILSQNRFGMKDGQEKWFLDLVGIATLSDMVPLTGENRALSYYGLKVLQKSPRAGLQKMWSKLGVSMRNISEDDIGFSLAPRLNAASRMGHPQDAFLLLRTSDLVEADTLSDHLNKINDERKGVVAALVKDIKKHLRERESAGPLPNVLVIGNPDWKPALLGLAANSVRDDFPRPIFLWGRNGDADIKGSCRSEGETNMVALMEATNGAFSQFGGHKMAGGFAVSHDKIHKLEESLNTAYETMPRNSESEISYIDAELLPEQINWDTYRHVEQLAPFGVGNPKPLFIIKGAKITDVKQFGKDKNHLEVSFERGSKPFDGAQGKPLKAISFFSKPESYTVTPIAGLSANIVATLEKSTFRNYPELRLRIVDII
jgi:single-stranded-DNA-specific exonuclease